MLFQPKESPRVPVEIGTVTSAPSGNQGYAQVSVKGRSQTMDYVPTAQDLRASDDVVLLRLNGSAQMPLVIGKGGYFAPK